ncbi:Lipoprotein, putative [Ketogulonicigenium robustum]|uniref:Lipoprotein, putative n=1 Tax=Ketogulonicigenium robustum TaxID=92947 RepID=A0A1W6P0P3_9RHOB|nr:DUF2927 domain-containing protein [Ketogulonicigenium robustum]ARO15082.1 Lipoprotein, putative [Ketogulonicigenium robustum]
MQTRGRPFTYGMAGLLALPFVAACTPTPPAPEAPPTPAVAPALPPARPAQPAVVAPSATSQALAQYYRRLQNDLLARNLLRTDGGPEVDITDTILARNFIRIALYDEYADLGSRFSPNTTESRLRRWEQPVRYQMVFGQTVPRAQRNKDQAEVSAYFGRLQNITGLQIEQSDDPNYLVMFLGEDDRPGAAAQLRTFIPGISESALLALMHPDRSTLCLVIAFADASSNYTYSRAVALIRAEHPDRMRSACIHEELAQGLGLANDDVTVRPSIFNDSEEFALLTLQDEMMLKILYDRRLRPGMTIDQATPIVRQIATEIISPPPV